MSTTVKVAVAANRTLPLDLIGDHLVRELASLPMDSTILLRRTAQKKSQPFERLARDVAISLGMTVDYYEPEGRGREASWARDWSMVRAADKVLLYVHGQVLGGGTRHLIDCAISEDIPTTAYYLTEEPEQMLAWLGGT